MTRSSAPNAIQSAASDPFGTYALPGPVEAIRRLGTSLPSSKIGRWCASLLRRICLKLVPDTVDVHLGSGIKTRLYPKTNRCEKRVLTAPQFFDAEEQTALRQAVQAHQHADPFVFLDVGANVGLYSLFLAAAAKDSKIDAHIIAIEPDLENRRRLKQNLAFSAFSSISVEAVAVAGASGQGRITGGEENRGEAQLVQEGRSAGTPADDEIVTVETLPDLITRLTLSRVDAMKIDIEGYDLAALTTLFKVAPTELWPRLIVAEVGRIGHDEPLTELCLVNGYEIHARARLNVILVRPSHAHWEHDDTLDDSGSETRN